MQPTPKDETSSDPPSLPEIAAAGGASDLFVFRRVRGDRFAHLGGVGRGEGWAGIVELGLEDEPLIREALAGGRPVRLERPAAFHVFGPYYARAAAVVPVSGDVFAVLGQPDGPLLERDDDDLTRAAHWAAEAIRHVSPAKGLADELEVLHAIRDVMGSPAGELDQALQSIVERAAAALSCEVGVLYLREPERVALANRGWSHEPAPSLVMEAMRGLRPRSAECPLCVQDAALAELPHPFSTSRGITSFYLLELGEPVSGLLLLMHTEQTPRGFTDLCRELGHRLVEAAGGVLATALAREELRGEIERVSRQARSDALTGLDNRLAWQEAIAAEGMRGHASAAIVLLDVDGLKRANDAYGHHVGDELLRALAETVRSCMREQDVVARIGGDELAVLMCDVGERECLETVGRLERAVKDHPAVSGLRLSATIGYAVSEDEDLPAAQRTADRRMYARKVHTLPVAASG